MGIVVYWENYGTKISECIFNTAILNILLKLFIKKKKKSTKRPQLNRVLRPEVGEMMIAEPKRKEKDSSSFLAKTQSMKTLDSFLTVALTASFPSMKLLPFPCCVGTHMWLTMIVVHIVILS